MVSFCAAVASLALRGVVDAAGPLRSKRLGQGLAAEELGGHAHVELAHHADVIGHVAGVLEQRMDVRQLQQRDGLVAQIGVGVQDLEAGAGWSVEHAGKGAIDALLDQDGLLKSETGGVGEQQRLLQHERRARQHGRVGHVAGIGLELLGELRCVLEGLVRVTGVGEHVVGEADHGLAFEHGLAGGVGVVVGDVLVVLLDVFGDALDLLAAPLVEADLLVLQSVGQLVRHHRLLLVDGHPVEQVHLLGLVVVEAGNLLGEQAEEEGAHLEVLVEQAELLEHQLAALHALGALVLVELLAQLRVDGARGR